MKSKIYVETSVISYLIARPNRDIIVAANQQTTQEWWQKRRLAFDLYISQLVIQEAGSGDPNAATARKKELTKCALLDITAEAIQLAENLVEQKAIPQKAAEDALHVAIAAVNGMDYLLTWNFKHIANATMRSNVELVCRLNGYEPPVICSPLELMEV